MTDAARYKLEVVAPVFPVADVRRSLEYYVAQLSFTVAFQWADRPEDPVRYAILQSGKCELHLSHSEHPVRTQPYVFVDGVSAFYEAVKARAPNITCEIEDQPWEMREFEVADPDGNRLIFGEHLSRLGDGKGEGKDGAG